MRLLNSDSSSSAEIAETVSRDAAMSAKILQLANSPLFGLRAEVSNVAHAVNSLGVKTVKSLALSLAVFSQFEPDEPSQILFHDTYQLALQVALLSKALAQAEGRDQPFQDLCFSSGLLCNIGRLVLAAAFWQECRRCLQLQKDEGLDVYSAEMATFGCRHGAVGGYLLGIWGLPRAIVEAVTWHDHPRASPLGDAHPVVPVHLAECYARWIAGDRSSAQVPVDEEFLARIAVADKMPQWLEVLDRAHQEVFENA